MGKRGSSPHLWLILFRRDPDTRRRLGDEDARGRARLDKAFDRERVVGANHSIARHRQLFRKATGRRQPRARADAGVPDGIAQLLHKLGGERLAPSAVEQDGYLHVARKRRQAAISIGPAEPC